MRVAVNGRFLLQEVSGVQRFAIEISQRYKDAIVIAPKKKFFSNGLFGHLWEQFYLPLYCYLKGYKLLNLCNSGPLMYSNSFLTLHDVLFKDFPEFFSFKFRIYYNFIVPRLCKKAKVIFTVSEYSKYRIIENYNVDEKKIIVLGNSVNESLGKNKYNFKEVHNITNDYVLFIGGFQKRKNYSGMISAWNRSNSKKKYDLVIVGGGAKNLSNDSVEKDNSIIHVGYLSDDLLFAAYRQSKLVCFLSYAEGFGIPVLEGWFSRTPVICSNQTALTDFDSTAVEFVSPNCPDQIANKVDILLESDEMRNRLIKNGLQQLSKYKWEIYVNRIMDKVN